MLQKLDHRIVALPRDRIEQRFRARNCQYLGIRDFADVGEFVIRLGHQPARGGDDKIMAGAPIDPERFQVTPPLVISKVMGSGLLALGSSIVTRNFRPPTSFRYFS